MPAAVARAGPRDVALPKALKEGFLGRPTPTARSDVAGAAESGDGVAGFVGRPRRELTELADRGAASTFTAGADGADAEGTGVAAEAPAAGAKIQMLDSIRPRRASSADRNSTAGDSPFAASAAFFAFHASNLSRLMRSFSSSGVSACLTLVGADAPFSGFGTATAAAAAAAAR